ncbi:hypothetical protein [Streptomyces soliscabiei]|uniref:hypothetical protein n=1 Tax=Streptomyces soliscabiei TaxID=588897 RepID=UPI0029B94D98|nr:hypothetical protein [Streptomyces sp. NY05-11A]MDX2679293.1 hypothetical protein [Streptomyces sp. NY05-11A]
MRIRITQGMPEGAVLNGEPWPAEGEEVDIPTAQGAHLVASGVAEEVVDTPPARGRRSRTKGGDDG